MAEWTAEEIVAKALYELRMMKSNSCVDYGRLEHILLGKA